MQNLAVQYYCHLLEYFSSMRKIISTELNFKMLHRLHYCTASKGKNLRFTPIQNK